MDVLRVLQSVLQRNNAKTSKRMQIHISGAQGMNEIRIYALWDLLRAVDAYNEPIKSNELLALMRTAIIACRAGTNDA